MVHGIFVIDAWGMPKCVVIDNAFDWGDDRPPRTPLHSSVIYELHSKGFTKLNPRIPEEIRGTYSGVGERGVDQVPEGAWDHCGRASSDSRLHR